MTISYCNWNETPPDELRRGALAIGNFDGVHRGHGKLLDVLKQRAPAAGGPAVVLTFDPHPLQLLRPAQFQPLLTTVAYRAELLQARGADHVLILRTTQELLHLRALEFFHQVVCKQMAARVLVEGSNFGFGRDREGNIDSLRTLCRQFGMELAVVPALTGADGVPVSSSRVRAALLNGDVRGATLLLDRHFRLRGTVVSGQKRGQSLGFPTANLEHVHTLVPKDGVYAVRVQIVPVAQGAPGVAGAPQVTGAGDEGKSVWPGAANIGPNPTFGEQARKVEVHLIGFQGDLYGRELDLDFIDRLRDTRPFAGPAQLALQLRVDVDQAHQLAEPADGSGLLNSTELKERVARLLTEEIGPALHMDGANIEVLDIRAGVVQVRLHGACGRCPSSIMAVIMGIEQELRRRVPEVEYLEAVP